MFYTKNYDTKPKPLEEEKSFSNLEKQIKDLNERLSNLEKDVNKKLEKIDNNLDKLLQSHKSLIEYFYTMNNHDIRNLNYNLREFSVKGNQSLPMTFVPTKSKGHTTL